jgi:AcrR family transcriptional regulator
MQLISVFRRPLCQNAFVGSATFARRPDGGPRQRRGRPTIAEAALLDEAIREAALELFLERDYDGTTMDAIAKAAGTTKGSLYTRFENKAEVFRDVLIWATHRSGWPVPDAPLPAFEDLRTALVAIGHAAVDRALDPTMVRLSQIAASQALRFPEVAWRTHASTNPPHALLAELLRRHAATGEIQADDPELLSVLFLGLVGGVPARVAMFGVRRTPAEQDRHTDAIVDLFLRALRPD